MIEVLNKLETESTSTVIKPVCDKPTANILNGEKLKAFPPRSGTKQGCPLLPLPFNKVLEILASIIKN